ncbi:hypothetical protein FZEAL_323, partial [Fusarium zealandicum]
MARSTWIIVLADAGNVISTLAQDEQRPLNEDAAKEIKYHAERARPAQITIYNSPKRPCVPENGHPTTDVDLPLDHCVSADFTLDNNVHLTYPGLCVGGTRKPYLALYPSSDCTGEYSHPGWYDSPFSVVGPGQCLSKAVWGRDITPPEGKWSMMLRCDDTQGQEPTNIINITTPEPPAKPEPKPARPRPTTASVSDSACFIPGIGMAGTPKFIFQRPEADTCINVAPKHQLKIYRNALCPNGTEALFARFNGRGCKGGPVALKTVDESIMANNSPSSCIPMGGDDASSYAFWCSGDLEDKSVKEDLFPDDGGRQRLHYTYGNPQ